MCQYLSFNSSLKIFALLLLCSPVSAHPIQTQLTPNYQQNVEGLRANKALQAMPDIVQRYQGIYQGFSQQYQQSQNELQLTALAASHGTRLWQQAVRDVQSGFVDDRPLYWGRLMMQNQLGQLRAGFSVASWQKAILQKTIEKTSRGLSDIQFDPANDINVLLTGFDPFFLDKDISQSNPSGLVALALDGYRFTVNGKKVQIETAMIPVRFNDFDMGLIESLLTPWYRNRRVQMVLTVSMGREGFDLERFPGLNRSAEAPDNLNSVTHATPSQPKAPQFNGRQLMGPEFVEFSLPVSAMTAVKGPWKVTDNRRVTSSAKGSFEANSLAELASETSVEGSGGGYLSNEISYRSLLLKQQLGLTIPVGHIHTPRVSGHDAQNEAKIVEQVRAMIEAAASTIN
jgi:pyrrolidone-carboxylate peptidase